MTESAPISALLDANILYPAGLRDICIQLALQDLYQPKWTEKILEEWMRVDRRVNRKHDPVKVRHMQRKLNSLDFDARIERYEFLIEDLALPDPDDRHVLAAAIHGGCEYIVTQNLKDFPESELAQHGIKALHPDKFLSMLFDEDTLGFLASVRAILEKLKNPPFTVEQYIALREQDGLKDTAARLRQHAHLLD